MLVVELIGSLDREKLRTLSPWLSLGVRGWRLVLGSHLRNRLLRRSRGSGWPTESHHRDDPPCSGSAQSALKSQAYMHGEGVLL